VKKDGLLQALALAYARPTSASSTEYTAAGSDACPETYSTGVATLALVLLPGHQPLELVRMLLATGIKFALYL